MLVLITRVLSVWIKLKNEKQMKDKRCVLEQDASIVAKISSFLDDYGEFNFLKEEDHYVIDLHNN